MSVNILVINPGATSTKLALYKDEKEIHNESVTHDRRDLDMLTNVSHQVKYRMMAIGQLIHKWNLDIESIDAVAARGGPLMPLPAGTYAVDAEMVIDIMQGNVMADHPSSLGAVMARKLMAAREKPAFIIDPVCVDEMMDIARISGLADIERKSLWHALNCRYTARLAAKAQNMDFDKSKIVVAHLGSGISVVALKNGKAIDVSNANEQGPFSVERAGALPVTSLAKYCANSNQDAKDLSKKLTKQSGLIDYLGTSSLFEVENKIESGDDYAKLIFDAMAYQTAKEIGAMSAALKGADLIVLTGGMANSERLVNTIKEYIANLADIHIIAGEKEMEALAMGALRVINENERSLSYSEIKNGKLKGASE